MQNLSKSINEKLRERDDDFELFEGVKMSKEKVKKQRKPKTHMLG
jgi:hypothetical protein